MVAALLLVLPSFRVLMETFCPLALLKLCS